MLQNLSIQNYALINNVEINFDKGLTIITGETGAGKSILLGALGLLIGQRADVSVLKDKTKKCIVEGNFNVKDYDLSSFFKTNELDFEINTIIRREINPTGISRAFINDTPVTLNILKDLGLRLIDIHSQHQTLTLNESSFQLSLVDSFAQHISTLETYKSEFKKFKKLKSTLSELEAENAASQKELDYLQFQFTELENANLQTGEQQVMEQELETLTHAEEIKLNIAKCTAILDESEVNILTGLAEVKSNLNTISKFNEGLQAIQQRVESVYIELKDVISELNSTGDEINYDPQQIELITGKLDNIYRLQKKHTVNSVDELIKIQNELSDRLQSISFLDEKIESLKKEIDASKKELEKLTNELSGNRKKVAPQIEKELVSMLSELGMPDAALKVAIEQLEDFDSSGKDNIRFLFSANKGSDPKELNKVASGGELSRLMLSLKALMSRLKALPTIIFDEIDTGVSGDVANKMGLIMDRMAGQMQVVAITHLPQIASKGKSHLFVYKNVEVDKTVSQIKSLNKDERILELAKMLSTGTPTSAAIKNAKELLKV